MKQPLIEEIAAKSIIRKYKKIDSWFLSRYGINLYRGCEHNCSYCDGRAEKYQTQNDFGNHVQVKMNALEIFEKELQSLTKRKYIPKGYFFVCGGVCDAYQPHEQKIELTRKALKLLLKYRFPVHIITKSTLVERDTDILIEMNKYSRALVSMSFSSTDDDVSKIFEPGASLPSEKLSLMNRLKKKGITCGMCLLPVIPFITDTEEMIEKSLNDGKQAGVDYVLFGNLTLKEGRQKKYYFQLIQKFYPHLLDKYNDLYSNKDASGSPGIEYITHVHHIYNDFARRMRIPRRIPFFIYKNLMSLNDQIIIMLEHLDYLCSLNHVKNSYGYAAYSLSKLKEPIESYSNDNLLKLGGIGPFTIKLIKEIIKTGTCKYFENQFYQ